MKLLLALTILVCVSLSTSAQSFPNPSDWSSLPDQQTTEWARVTPYGAPISFHFNHYRYTNSDSTLNQVMNFGWNIAPGGGEVVSGYGRPNMQFESNYLNVYGVRLQEIHFGFGDKRVMQSEWNTSTGFLSTVFRADNMNFTDGSNNVRMQLYNGVLILDNSTVIRSVNNNVRVYQQYNAAGNATISPAFIDSTNSVVLGDNNAPIKLKSMILNGVTVTYGAANSAGTGLKCLAVAN